LNLTFDTSALVKVLIGEPGTDLARRLWEGGPPVLSALAYPEVCSALTTAARLERVSHAEIARARQELPTFWGAATVVDVSPPIAGAAGELAIATGLKGADAVHLATALSVGPESTVLVTWDKALSRAAQEHGLAVAP
jgi:hypothetical protein